MYVYTSEMSQRQLEEGRLQSPQDWSSLPQLTQCEMHFPLPLLSAKSVGAAEAEAALVFRVN